MLGTIGYEKTTLEDFVTTLVESDIDVLVDIRERAQSRRRGFSKTALNHALREYGIQYLHFRELGDPKEGRDAARAGDMQRFKRVFSSVLNSQPAKRAIQEIAGMASTERIVLMCYERDHRHCHRKMVADELEKMVDCAIVHLKVDDDERAEKPAGRMLHSG
jgi:uncharacterized protein (DUF488 family)